VDLKIVIELPSVFKILDWYLKDEEKSVRWYKWIEEIS